MVGRLDQLRTELMRQGLLAALPMIVMAACIDGQAATHRPVERATLTGVDSILPAETALARFLSGVVRPDGLSGGSPSMGNLVDRFSDALEHQDSLSLMTMAVTRAEYGYFYYPSSLYVRDPYELPPDVAWLLSSQENSKAMRRLLQRLGGKGVTLHSASCAKAELQGGNVVHSDCSVLVGTGSRSENVRLFRSIIERDGAMKFLSYAGDF
jgi:hypothetical protein